MKLTRLIVIVISAITLMAFSTPGFGTPFDSAVQFSDNGHYYQVFTTLRTWDNAGWAAGQMGGYLATITSSAENNFITGLLPVGVNAWLGGFQPPGSSEPAGSWQWITGEPFNYANWNTGEPNNGVGWNITDESTLEIYGVVASGLGKWNDVRPDSYYASVVEFDTMPQGIPEPAAPPVPAPDRASSLGLLCMAFLVMIPASRLGRRASATVLR